MFVFFYQAGAGAQSARIARGDALLPAPLEGEEGQVAELDDPGYRVGGYYELMIENRFFVHALPPAE
jgi:hypothetical protein